MPTHVSFCRVGVLVLSVNVLVAGANAAAPQAAPGSAAAAPADAKPFKPEELQQLVAPVALYPDALLAQILMACTYPLEVVQADRWATEHKNLKGDALTAALEKVSWDPSVKSLVSFPQVLTMMSQQLDWTTKLGDAFIANQAAVMAAVQTLRARAQAEGNLKDTPEQKIIVEPAPPAETIVMQGEAPPPQIIRIESPSPDIIYVPAYNPAVVYGGWPYPAYPPPPPYYPPGYVASNLISFGAGLAVGAAWGYAWGGCNWGHGEVDIDVNRNAEFNRSINRESYKANMESRRASRQGGTANGAARNGFQHDPAHRKGVSYRDQATARQVGQPANRDAARARDSYRGRAEAGRQDIARGGADQFRGGGNVNRAGLSASQLPANRGGAGNSLGRSDLGRTGSAGARPSAGTYQSRGGAFAGVDRGGAAARASSNRGQMSRSTPAQVSRSAAPRSGGGGFSGGGGGRGGGGGFSGGGGGGRGGGGGGGGRR